MRQFPDMRIGQLISNALYIPQTRIPDRLDDSKLGEMLQGTATGPFQVRALVLEVMSHRKLTPEGRLFNIENDDLAMELVGYAGKYASKSPAECSHGRLVMNECQDCGHVFARRDIPG